MTTLPGRPRTALLVIDVQNDVVAHAHRRDAVVGAIAVLVDRARAEGVPVVWVQHSDDGLPTGSSGWQYVPELVREGSEPLVAKRYGDSFESTELETVLAERGVGRLVVTGAETDACIRSTLHGALVRGYDALLVSDAHTTSDLSQWGAPPPEQVIAHTNLYWSAQSAPGRTAGTATSSAVDLRPPVPQVSRPTRGDRPATAGPRRRAREDRLRTTGPRRPARGDRPATTGLRPPARDDGVRRAAGAPRPDPPPPSAVSAPSGPARLAP